MTSPHLSEAAHLYCTWAGNHRTQCRRQRVKQTKEADLKQHCSFIPEKQRKLLDSQILCKTFGRESRAGKRHICLHTSDAVTLLYVNSVTDWASRKPEPRPSFSRAWDLSPVEGTNGKLSCLTSSVVYPFSCLQCSVWGFTNIPPGPPYSFCMNQGHLLVIKDRYWSLIFQLQFVALYSIGNFEKHISGGGGVCARTRAHTCLCVFMCVFSTRKMKRNCLAIREISRRLCRRELWAS